MYANNASTGTLSIGFHARWTEPWDICKTEYKTHAENILSNLRVAVAYCATNNNPKVLLNETMGDNDEEAACDDPEGGAAECSSGEVRTHTGEATLAAIVGGFSHYKYDGWCVLGLLCGSTIEVSIRFGRNGFFEVILRDTKRGKW